MPPPRGKPPAPRTVENHGLRRAASGAVHVTGDVIAFTPSPRPRSRGFSRPTGQSDGAVFDGSARFADGSSHSTYRFDLPSGVTGGTLTLDIGNQFLVQVSPDNQSWRTVLEASLTGDVGLRNRAERSLDLNDLRGESRTLYVRIADAYTTDGWGGWLARLSLEMQR